MLALLCFAASGWDGPAVDGHHAGAAGRAEQREAWAPVHRLQTARLHEEAARRSPDQSPAGRAAGEHVPVDDGEVLCGGGHTLQEEVGGKKIFFFLNDSLWWRLRSLSR